MMEHVDCPVCESPRADAWGMKDDASYVRCGQCGLVYENPRLTAGELRNYYSQESYFVKTGGGEITSGYENYFTQCTPRLTAEYFSILRKHAPEREKIKFLDVGCGPGNLLAEASKHGWTSIGLEISHWAAEKGKESGVTIIEAPLESAGFGAESFDVISLFDVLEHLPAPRTVLSEARRILKPGGVIIVETPNIEGFFVRHLYGTKSDMVKPRAHICLYSPAAVKRLFLSAGFSNVSVRTFPYCRKYTPGYFKRIAATLLGLSASPTQLTINESLRIVAWK